MPTPWDKDLINTDLVPELVPPKLLLSSVKYFDEQRLIDKNKEIIINLQGADYKGGIIPHALNIPAENFFNCIFQVLRMIIASNIGIVWFYNASSDGRAKRIEGLFKDYVGSLTEAGYIENNIIVWELKGGIEA